MSDCIRSGGRSRRGLLECSTSFQFGEAVGYHYYCQESQDNDDQITGAAEHRFFDHNRRLRHRPRSRQQVVRQHVPIREPVSPIRWMAV